MSMVINQNIIFLNAKTGQIKKGIIRRSWNGIIRGILRNIPNRNISDISLTGL